MSNFPLRNCFLNFVFWVISYFFAFCFSLSLNVFDQFDRFSIEKEVRLSYNWIELERKLENMVVELAVTYSKDYHWVK